jgi:alanine-glyoxylate transaminase/serine-glyoxylate transaminase/serine-pyruvate transaminase
MPAPPGAPRRIKWIEEGEMLKLNSHPSGRHYLQIPGPTNVPDRILRAIDHPTIDHRGPEFQRLARKVLADIRKIFQTTSPVVILSSSGTGAWEAALVNTLGPGDAVLMYETGHFSVLWHKMALRLGLDAELLPGDWRSGVDADAIEARLRGDASHRFKAVCVVHNETSTGVTSDIAAVRRAIDRAGHPALLLVDAISSLASIDYRHDEWGVDVTVSGSQKGLMLPPGLAFNAVSARALAATAVARLPRSYWSWPEIIEANGRGFWPTTPATNLLYGLSEACDMLLEEGLDRVFARHRRLAEATRRAVQAWGLETVCRVPAQHSASLTGVLLPAGHDADALRREALEHFNISLGQGLGKLAGRAFRIGHLGDLNELALIGALGGVEMALAISGVPHRAGGVQAAMQCMLEQRAAAADTAGAPRVAATG